MTCNLHQVINTNYIVDDSINPVHVLQKLNDKKLFLYYIYIF